MNLKFLEHKFDETIFQEFITKAFDEFELIDGNYKTDNLSQSDMEHISEYRYLGESFLDDDSEIGVLILRSTTKNIEKRRVAFSKIISKLSKPYGKETILVAIYHNESPIWRLTFSSYDFRGGMQTQRTDGKRYTYILGEDIAIATAKSRIGMLFSQSKTSQEMIEDIFSVEKVSREFFDKYKKLYFDTLKELQPQMAIFGDDKGLTLFTKKLLGRIVFLYFLQKKGWLVSDDNWENGDKKFLRNCFDKRYKKYDDFYTQILQPIFFEALNQDRENSIFDILNCRIPYLNGGLFSRDSFDKDSRIIIENSIFKNIFGLFDQYNFTIIEDTPHDSEVAIDPEMLGKIFEDLLEDRKDKGAFYTPREIVHYMSEESIKYYLQTKPKEKTELEYLKEIKILDPAIGSGAFPMGMLHEIVEARIRLGDTTPISKLKREIIENSIYGVDIEPSAVEIAKLRFWLSIVVDEDIPTPLPNLFYKIMVGNSLIETINGFDPLESEDSSLFGTDDSIIDEIKVLFHEFYNSSDNTKKLSIQEDIESKIDEVLNKKLDIYNDELKSQLNNINLLGFDKKQTKLIEDLNSNISLIEKVKKRPTTELFFYKLYFAEVINSGGFDVVIGNPPYVRHEKIRDLKPKLKIEGYNSYNGTADLYIYFFEQGYRLLRDNGSLSFITSNKYTRAKYGKPFREFILDNTNILEYIDFNDIQIFESATVATSIFSFRKSQIKNNDFTYASITNKYKKDDELAKYIREKGFNYSQNDLTKESFIFINLNELVIKKQIEDRGDILKNWDITIRSGIKTGFNEAFIIDEKTKNELIEKDNKNSKIIKPLLRGRDIKKYEYNFANKWLINIHNNPPIDINSYPSLKKYFEQYINKLESRTDKGDTPYNLRSCAYLDDFKKDKIVWLELSDNAKFTLDKKQFILEMTVFFINGNNLKYLLALLNSKLIFWYFNIICAESGVGTNRWKKIYVEQLPIPKISKVKQKPFEILVDYILFAKENSLDKESSLFESIIDGMVYDLYFEDEMKQGDCFISDEVTKVIKEFDDTIEMIEQMYSIFKDNRDIQRGLIYRRVISVVKVINGGGK